MVKQNFRIGRIRIRFSATVKKEKEERCRTDRKNQYGNQKSSRAGNALFTASLLTFGIIQHLYQGSK